MDEERFELPRAKMALWAVIPGDHDDWQLIRADFSGPGELILDDRQRAYLKALFEIAERNLYPLKTVTV